MNRDQNALKGAKRYQELVKANAPKPKIAQGLWRAFLVGGLIALVGEAVFSFFLSMERAQPEAIATTLAAMIFLGAILTGFGVYDKIAEYGGMGAALPITGFSNTVVAAAMDFRREGLLLGLASKMFVIAGPVIVYGVTSGILVGLLVAAAKGFLVKT